MKVTCFGVNITKNCNINCEHCLCGNVIDESINIDVIKNMFNGVDEIGELYLTGGEPLLRPDLIMLLKDEIKKRKLNIEKITLTTNATILNEKTKQAILYLFEGVKASIKVSADQFHEKAVERLYMSTNKKYKENTFALLIKNYFDFCKKNNIEFKKEDVDIIALMGRALNLDQSKFDIPFIFVNNTFNALGNYSPKQSLYDDILTIDTTGNVLACDYENTEVDNLSIGNILNNSLENIIYQRCILELEKKGIKSYEDEFVKTAIEYYYKKRYKW